MDALALSLCRLLDCGRRSALFGDGASLCLLAEWHARAYGGAGGDAHGSVDASSRSRVQSA